MDIAKLNRGPLTVVKIVCQVAAGGEVYRCQQAAAVIALENSADVEFCHNGATYTVSYGDLIKQVKGPAQ